MQSDDEAKLIAKAKGGDEQAVALLYDAHVQAIYRYVYYRVSDENTAEDLTADTFLRAIEGLEGYEYRGVPFRAWLYRIAFARVVDFHRKQGRRIQQPLDTVNPVSDVDLEAVVATRLAVERLAELLPRLTEEQQNVIVLRFIEGYSIEETAGFVDKTEGAVKALQHRALRSLARIYKDEFGAFE